MFELDKTPKSGYNLHFMCGLKGQVVCLQPGEVMA